MRLDGTHHTQSSEIIFSHLRRLQTLPAGADKRFRLEWVLSSVGDLVSAATYREVTALDQVDHIPSLLSPPDRLGNARLYYEFNKDLVSILLNLERSVKAARVATLVDLGYVLPLLQDQATFIQQSDEVFVVTQGTKAGIASWSYLNTITSIPLRVLITGESQKERERVALIAKVVFADQPNVQIIDLPWIPDPIKWLKMPIADIAKTKKLPDGIRLLQSLVPTAPIIPFLVSVPVSDTTTKETFG